MCKKTCWIGIVMLVTLLTAPVVAAQAATPAEVVQQYYTALGQAAAGGDVAGLLDLFAEDATVTVAGLTPQPVSGKEAIQTALGGMLALLKGLTVTLGEVSVAGEQVTVSYTMATAGNANQVPATDIFVIRDGKIQSLTITIAPEALAGVVPAVPATLPTTGGAMVNLLPVLLVLGGMALTALSRRAAA